MKASYAEFVKVWQHSSSQAEVMEALGISRSACEHAAKLLRKKGVNLKRYSNQGSRTLDEKAVAELNALCETKPDAPQG